MPCSPWRVDEKYNSPARDTDTNTSDESELSGGPGSMGSPQPEPRRSTYQVLNEVTLELVRGRLELK